MAKSLARSILLEPALDLLSRPPFQPLLERVHRFCMMGMNYGGGYSLDRSGELWVLQQLRPPPQAEGPLVLFDVGANEGQYAETAYRVLGNSARIYSFEPSPRAFCVLSEKLGAIAPISIFDFGLGDQEETALLFANDAGSMISSLYQRRDYGDVEGRESCRLRTLDQFCEEQGIGRIHHLKLDVEGNELKALHGASRMLQAGAIDQIQFEFGEAQVESRSFVRDFFDLLEKDYRLHRILRRGLQPLPRYDVILEVYRTTNYLAVRR
jgi:FkbM family methyltransferase